MERRPVRAAPICARHRCGAPGRRACSAGSIAGIRARPGIGETALAVDVEGRLGDRISSALELAVGVPGVRRSGRRTAKPATVRRARSTRRPRRIDSSADSDATPWRPRGWSRDACSARGFRGRRRPAPSWPHCSSRPVLFLPNPQDAVIAQQQQLQEAAERQADRIERVAEDLESRGEDANDPRTQLAEELRELALRLREHPDELEANLARLGAIEDQVRAQIDPANEQRAASLASLSRALSRAATGKPDANRDGDPEETREDLDRARPSSSTR